MKSYISEMITKWKTSFTNLKRLRHEYTINDTHFYSIKIDQIQYYLFNILYTSEDYYVSNTEEYCIDVICDNTYGDNTRYPLILLLNGLDGLEDVLQGNTIMLPTEDTIVDIFASFKKEYYVEYINEEDFMISEEEIQSFTYKTVNTLEDEVINKFYDIILEIGGI